MGITRADAETVLRRLAGEQAWLRPDQWVAIEALVLGTRRVLCVQRTGWGKSAVYFIATALLREQGSGPTVIVSPLLALMRNQVEAAQRAGIHARTINSANLEEWEQISAEIAAGSVDVLLISPERLNNPDFRESVLPKLASTTGLLVVDEAHCVSDWGHDFRPDYRRLRTLLAELAPGTPVLATTATANARVSADIAEQLGDALVLRGSLDRESLRLSVVDLPTPAHRLAWLGEQLRKIEGSGIVYTLTVAAAHETAEYLRSQGYAVLAYTGQSEDSERREAEQGLLQNSLKALVATSAPGMGFDKPDLGFVVHLGAPSSPIAYYQQVGRAGRAVDKADVVLLPGPEDEAIWRYFASLAFPPEEHVRQVLAELARARHPLSTQVLEARVELRRARLELMLKVLDVDGAVRRVKGGWQATGEPWAYDSERLERIAEARSQEQQAMRGYRDTPRCRMEFLRRCLDDDNTMPCGRCDRCAGPPHDTQVSPPALASARAFLSRPGVEIEPRRMWPTGMGALGVQVTGKIPRDEQALHGRAVGRLTDLGWGDRLRLLLADAAPDKPAPPDLLVAVVEVLKSWSAGPQPWAERPVAVVAMGSSRRPRLIASVAEHISRVGRLPLLGTVATSSTMDSGRANSAHRVKALHGTFTAPPELAHVTGPVLLVDDLVDSGWTMALAARELRLAGAPAVLPLALAITS